MAIENSLNKAKITLTEEQIKQTQQDIINSIKNTLVNVRNANTNERNMLNNEWKTEIEKKLRERGLDQEDTKILMDGIETALSIYSNNVKY